MTVKNAQNVAVEKERNEYLLNGGDSVISHSGTRFYSLKVRTVVVVIFSNVIFVSLIRNEYSDFWFVLSSNDTCYFPRMYGDDALCQHR